MGSAAKAPKAKGGAAKPNAPKKKEKDPNAPKVRIVSNTRQDQMQGTIVYI